MPRTPAAGRTPHPGASVNRTPTAAPGRGDVEPPTPARSSQPEPVPAEGQLCLQVADRVVHDIFSVSLTLSSARTLTEGLTAARLDQAIDDLDGLVRGLHHAAVAAQSPDRSRSRPNLEPSTGDTPAGKTEPALLEKAEGALLQVDRLLVGLWTDAVASAAPPSARERITEATRLVRLARNSLTATAVS